MEEVGIGERRGLEEEVDGTGAIEVEGPVEAELRRARESSQYLKSNRLQS